MAFDLLTLSDRVYRSLLIAYPATFHKRYGVEMAQVFRTCCRITYRSSGVGGIVRLWLSTLWDWALTAIRERLSSLFEGRVDLMDTTALDHQLGDMVWVMTTALRADYSVPQIFEAMVTYAPEPAASLCRRLVDDLQAGCSLEDALENLQKVWPSAYLARVVETMRRSRQTGGNLAAMLDPVGQEILQQAGSDESFYPEMRQVAKQLGSPLPERARPRIVRDRPPPLPDAEQEMICDEDGSPLLTVDYLYRRAKVMVWVSGSPNHNFYLPENDAKFARLLDLGYRLVVIRKAVADAGLEEVATRVCEVYPDIELSATNTLARQ